MVTYGKEGSFQLQIKIATGRWCGQTQNLRKIMFLAHVMRNSTKSLGKSYLYATVHSIRNSFFTQSEMPKMHYCEWKPEEFLI